MTGTYNFWLVALFYVIATIASYCTLEMAGRIGARRGCTARRSPWPDGAPLPPDRSPRTRFAKLGAALVMGLAICGMHYTGMADAVSLAADDDADLTTNLVALVILGLTLVILALALVSSAFAVKREAGGGRAGSLPTFERFLTMRVSMAVVGAFLVYAVATHLIVLRPAEREWINSEMARAAGGAPWQVGQMALDAETLVASAREWGKFGHLNPSHEAGFVRMMMPLLRQRDAISSVAITRDDGRQVLLVQLPAGGGWQSQTTDSANWGQRRLWRHYNLAGEKLGEEWRADDYDPRLRPWYQGALQHGAGAKPYWTEPYLLPSNGLPAVLVASSWVDPISGRTSVISFAFNFDDLTTITKRLRFGESGQVTLLTGKGQLITLPRNEETGHDETRKALYLKQPGEAGYPGLEAAYRAWTAAGKPSGRPIEFMKGDSRWLAHFEQIPIPGQEYLMVAYAPRDEFDLNGSKLVVTAVLLMLLVLAAAFAIGRIETRRFGRSVQHMVRETERIGALDLERPVEAEVFTREFAELRDSQEKTRRLLLQATRHLEQTVADRTSELEKARAAADVANRAKSEFLANMSHEIRTPMNAVMGMTQLALGAEPDARLRRYLEHIDAAAKALLRIINDILDFSKIEAGKLDLERAPFRLEEVLDQTVALAAPRAQQKELEFLLHLEPGLPTALVGDALRLGQVLLNLAGNAVKFTERGEIVLAVRALERSGAQVTLQFEVRDSGIGIPRERLDRLFQAFEQADASTTRQYGGTGLGLAISRRLVELMGGRIWAESEPGKGSTFAFTTPFDCQAAPTRRELAGAPDLAGKRVLVVDDHASAREILRELLESLRFRVGLASKGTEAIAAVCAAEAQSDPYQVVLMDQRMPGMDGVQTVRTLRAALDPTRLPKIVLVTAFEQQEAAADVPLDGFLTKPVTASLLFDALMEAFGCSEHVPVRTTQRTTAAPDLAGGRVLLVEDNEVNQELARELLERAGLSVATADNGKRALELAAAEHFDLVLMDLQMPVMDGYEATRAMRRIAALRDIPILAMTANVMAGDRQRCLEAGMNDHIAKPIDLNELHAKLKHWLGSRLRPASGAQPSSAFPTIEGVDVREGLARAAGDAGLYARILGKFCDNQALAAASLKEHLARGESKDARRVAHTLAGVAGNIGAIELEAAARAMETAIVNGEQPDPTRIERIEELLGRLRRDIGLALAAGAGAASVLSAAASADAAPPTDIAAGLADLERLIADHDTGAVAAFERLGPAPAGPAAAAAADLARHLGRYDFDAAYAALGALRAALHPTLEDHA